MKSPRLKPATLFLVTALSLAPMLAACDDSKDDILSKAEHADTRDELRAALGAPDDVSKIGPVETWTYKAKKGEVTFLIAGDHVTLSTADDSTPSEKSPSK